ncbi:MFS transporter [Bailinhaonella thermotolerans]|uniref:MFS transporter n=1 Tax=Bailinhaonella thermotolerans TaxID=1070861 RepID=A0A3A4A6Z9_9ACTN|nr:MFS transporter [Bailinhaonella thermotolerans]
MSRTRSALRSLLPDPGPTRALTLSTLVRTTGRGLFFTGSALYFTSPSVGLSGPQVGLGLTIAALVGLFAGVPSGRLADVIGPRGVTIVFLLVDAVALCGYTLVRDFTVFVLVACAYSFFESGSNASNQALIAGSVEPERRVRTRAYLRSVTNLGWSLGAVLCGVALAYGTREAYLALIFGAAACYAVGALLNLRVPSVPPAPKVSSGPVWIVLRDRPYIVLTLLNAVLCMCYTLLTLALPIWIRDQTSAPPAVYAILTLINTVAVLLFQVVASRGSATVAGAARAQRNSGVLLLACCVLFAFSAGQGLTPWIAIAFLVAGTMVHVGGELLQAAGSWGLSFELAPQHAQGQYQGMYGTGYQLAQVVTPVMSTLLLSGWGWPGWIVFGAAFLLAGLAVPVAARWAERTRPAEPVPAAA